MNTKIDSLRNPNGITAKDIKKAFINTAKALLIVGMLLQTHGSSVQVVTGGDSLSDPQLLIIGEDYSQHENECVVDADCNPGIANPARFTSFCGGGVDGADGSLIEAGGNQGMTCSVR